MVKKYSNENYVINTVTLKKLLTKKVSTHHTVGKTNSCSECGNVSLTYGKLSLCMKNTYTPCKNNINN